MAIEAPFWNPWLETLELERLKSIQLAKFKRILSWAYQHSRFYRRVFQEAGLEPGDIKTLEDVANAPKIDKSLLRTARVSRFLVRNDLNENR